MSDIEEVDSSYVINYFLYGDSKTPDNLTMDSIVRSGEYKSTIEVNGTSYMAKLGRFALPSTFELIQKFFDPTINISPTLDDNGNSIYKTEAEMRVILGVNQALNSVIQSQFIDETPDYAERALIWNSFAYEINDDAKFYIDADGTRHISNFAIIPYGSDDFDLKSDNIPTQIANELYLRFRLDPFNIGRIVKIDIHDDINRGDYTYSDFLRDKSIESTWSYPDLSSAFNSVSQLVDELHNRNIISPVDDEGRAIVYGSTENDSLSIFDIGNIFTPFYNSSEDITGVTFVGGTGVDTADYSNYGKSIRVNIYEDAIKIDRSSDKKIDDVSGMEIIKTSNYRDTIYIDKDITSKTSVTIDAGADQSSSVADVIYAKNSQYGITISINRTTGVGSITTDSGNGTIHLIGFHTGIIGSEYDDTIDDHNTGHKMIDAGDGDDVVSVGDDGAIIDGGAGSDTLTGGAGSDLIVGGDGISNILNGGGGSDLLVSQGFDYLQGLIGDIVNGGDGADKLVIKGWRAIVDGGAGNDVIDVQAGYYHEVQFGAGGGHDYVLSGRGSYTVDMSTLASSDVTLIWSNDATISDIWPPIGNPIDIAGSVGIEGKLTVLINATGDTITFEHATGRGTYQGFEYYDVSQIYDYSYDVPITFADNDRSYNDGGFQDIRGYITAPDDFAAGVQAGSLPQGDGNAGLGDDTIAGGSGDDSFSSSGGTDTIDGGGGFDEFVALGASYRFDMTSESDGTITLTDWAGIEGKITLKSVESIAFLGDDTTKGIESGTSGDDVLNSGIPDIVSAGAGNDIIVGGDQSVTLFGGSGDDQITGGSGDDIISGGTGNDQLAGGAGYDSYLWAAGDGNDTITDSADDGSNNDLQISGAVPISLDFSQDGDDLLINSNGQQVRVVGQFASSGLGGLDYIGFASGQYWDRQEIVDHATLVVNGTSADDLLVGSAASERFIGGAGNDIIEYSGGDDRYIWNIGDGDDQIVGASTSSSGSESVIFGASIAPENVSVRYVGGSDVSSQPSSILLSVAGEGSVRMDGFSTYNLHEVNVRFADGTIWDSGAIAAHADLQSTLITGTSGADTLDGWARADEFRGGLGDDTLRGSEGSDHYVYASGDGADIIGDFGYDAGIDVLSLVDLNQSQILLSRDDNNLFVKDLTTNQVITVQNQFAGGASGLESISFGDNSTLDRSSFEALASRIDGTSGNDYFPIHWSNFVLDAGAGDDVATVFGSGGGTILFGEGSGHDWLQSELGWGNVRDETLKLVGLNADDITLTQDGRALVVTVDATGDTFTAAFQYNYNNEKAGLSRLSFEDGTVWDRDDIDANLEGGMSMMSSNMALMLEPMVSPTTGRWFTEAACVNIV